jgi:NAD(P)-dependent dehydrogenase (short-subunit alcohol dehydrogenase family)
MTHDSASSSVRRDGRLAGLVAVVVGAGQTPGETIGNGRAIAETFAREGAAVLCVDRQPERAGDTVSAIHASGGDGEAFAADVTDAGSGDAILGAVLERWGRIDVLVNNVGVGGRGDGPAHSVDDEAFDRILAVNTRAMLRTCKAALPAMREQGHGSIVNISSAASFAGGFQIAYEVSKAAVNRLTTSIAQSNASRGVRCNAIALGLVDTPMAVGGIALARQVSTDAVRAERNERVPLRGGMGTAWDTANAALFLASDEARFITGVVLPVDGGLAVRIG